MPIGIRPLKRQVATAQSDKRSVVDSVEFATDDSVPEKMLYRGLSYDEMHRMYLANVWVRACVDRIIMRLREVQPTIRFMIEDPREPSDDAKRHKDAVEDLIANPNNGVEDFATIRASRDKDGLLYDAAAMEVVTGTDLGTGEERPIELYSVAGDTIKKNVDSRGVFRSEDEAYHQVDSKGQIVAKFPIGSLLYDMMYPSSGMIYGLSPLESLRQTVTAELYAAQYTLDFFSNDATPRFAVLFDNLGMGQADAAMKRVRAWWEQELKGRPHRPILMGTEQGQVRFQQVGLSNQDMQFQEYSRWLLTKIMAIYGMQPFVLGVVDVGTGKLNSQQQSEQFKKDTLAPRLRTFASSFNSHVIWDERGFGYDDVYMDWLAFMPKDEETQAKIHKMYWETGVMTINMIREELGLIPVSWGDEPFVPTSFVPFGSQGMPEQAEPPESVPEGEEGSEQDMQMPFIKAVADPTNLIGLRGIPQEDIIDVMIRMLKYRESALNTMFSFPASLFTSSEGTDDADEAGTS